MVAVIYQADAILVTQKSCFRVKCLFHNLTLSVTFQTNKNSKKECDVLSKRPKKRTLAEVFNLIVGLIVFFFLRSCLKMAGNKFYEFIRRMLQRTLFDDLPFCCSFERPLFLAHDLVTRIKGFYVHFIAISQCSSLLRVKRKASQS